MSILFDNKYSIFNLIKEYQKNKHIIHAYYKNDTIENYTVASTTDDLKNTQILGLSSAMFSLVFLISLAIFIWAVFVTIKFWKVLPLWAQVLAIIGLVTGFGGPIMTLIVVYLAKKK
jgi:hypothetical protein